MKTRGAYMHAKGSKYKLATKRQTNKQAYKQSLTTLAPRLAVLFRTALSTLRDKDPDLV